MLDPTAGGGSIPFESARLGFATFGNDLNPVASLIERATVKWPARFGMALVTEFRTIADKFVSLREERIASLFPPEPEQQAVSTNFLWARTIRCPYCEGLVPLSPNWRLAPDGTGVRLVPHCEKDAAKRRCDFEIVRTLAEQSPGTVADGDATCPFPDCRRVIEGDAHVKTQAQAGQMGDQLFAIVFKRRVEVKTKSGGKRQKWARDYRAPRPEDNNVAAVTARLAEKLPEWEALDFLPTEEYPEMYCDRSKIYGVNYWRDLFSARQLFCHVISVEVYRELLDARRKMGALSEYTSAAFVYLAFSLDKLRDYNSRMARWHVNREVTVNTFDRHDFSFKWSYSEMAMTVSGGWL